jgi:hypothetical protein
MNPCGAEDMADGNCNPMGETAYGWIPDQGLRFQNLSTVVDVYCKREGWCVGITHSAAA